MRRICIKIVLLALIPAFGLAQRNTIDSLHKALKNARTDSDRYFATLRIGRAIEENNRDTSLYYNDLAFHIAKKSNKALAEASALVGKGYSLMHLGRYAESLQCLQQALDLAEDGGNEKTNWYTSYRYKNYGIKKLITLHENRLSILTDTHFFLALLMGATNNVDKKIIQLNTTKRFAAETGYEVMVGFANMHLGYIYLDRHRIDTALELELNAARIFSQNEKWDYSSKSFHGGVYRTLGNIYLEKGNKELAVQYFHKALNAGLEQNNLALIAGCYHDLTRYYIAAEQMDSSLYYAKKHLEILHSMRSEDLGDAYEYLYHSYRLQGYTDSAYKYQGLALMAKDSSYEVTIESLADFQKLSFGAQLRAQELEKEKAAIQTKIRTYVLIAGIGVFMLLAGIFYWNNRQKQKANKVLETTLTHLKATQTQLIQSEKMASLGELTAGIAHEIQNPLNFVNNFSDVNTELIGEMKQEIDKGDLDEIKAIATDIEENSKKINQHGKRAAAIVNGMLQHCKSGSGTKEPTNINALAGECMHLAYHGLRAKDKSFNAELVTHFDETLPPINVIPQDIVRVMINLFNNAFYAVNQKAKHSGEGYIPEVSVTTLSKKDGVIIRVKDNGIGIPEAIKDKIMQPFFTTKPTGEGTGLGLSLTYDMVVNGHGGVLTVDTKENKYSIFTIQLPL